jgi:hypothetical protein
MITTNLIRIIPTITSPSDKKISCMKQKAFIRPTVYNARCVSPPSHYVKNEQRSIVMCSMHNNSTELIELSKSVGHAIVSFTAIYCSLNWSLYRTIRKQIEKNKCHTDQQYDQTEKKIDNDKKK